MRLVQVFLGKVEAHPHDTPASWLISHKCMPWVSAIMAQMISDSFQREVSPRALCCHQKLLLHVAGCRCPGVGDWSCRVDGTE